MSLEQHSTPLGATIVAYGTPLKCTPSGHSLQKAYTGCPRVKPLSIICLSEIGAPWATRNDLDILAMWEKLKLTIRWWRSCKQQDACSEVEIWVMSEPGGCALNLNHVNAQAFFKNKKIAYQCCEKRIGAGPYLLAKGYNLIFNITWPQRPLHLQSGYGMDCVRTSDNLWACLWEAYVLHFSFFYQLLHCSHLLHHTACWINTHPLPPVSNDRKYVKRMDRER